MIVNLKKLRREVGISQQQLADIIMVSQQSVNKYENHDVEPNIETLIKIADFFDVPIDYLVGRTDIKECVIDDYNYKLTKEEKFLLKEYRMLNENQKKCIVSVINSYK